MQLTSKSTLWQFFLIVGEKLPQLSLKSMVAKIVADDFKIIRANDFKVNHADDFKVIHVVTILR